MRAVVRLRQVAITRADISYELAAVQVTRIDVHAINVSYESVHAVGVPYRTAT